MPSWLFHEKIARDSENAGFRPGRRPTFLSGKVGKTIDAQSGHIGGVGRKIEERTNSLRSNKARRI